MYVWITKSKGHKIVWLNIHEAWADLKEREGFCFIYLKLMRPEAYEQLKEFEGF